jgi:hypothetical protein
MKNINNGLNNLIKAAKIVTVISLMIFFNAGFVYADSAAGLANTKAANTKIHNAKITSTHLNLNKKLYSRNYFIKHKKRYEAALKECKTLNYQTASLTAKNNCAKATMLKFFKVIKIKKK